MPYTPVTFVDGSTPLNAANLNQVEDGVEAAERTENKGQPGGYPALDADGKVPSAQLPATGGSAALGEFQFSTTISEPPASGRIRMNNADQTLATLLWISDTTSGAVAVGSLLGSIVVGEQIYIQDKNDAALYRLYDVTALPVAKAGYHEIAVTFNKGAGAAFANNETLFCTIQRLAGGGADLDYEGDYVAATEYQDGDVVVKDGVAYLCVGGPTTVAPDPAPWGAAALAKVAYGTTLPASPVDGQEAILVDSLTNPSYQWRFRYNAGSSSAYKWEFVGGSPKVFNYDQGGAAMNTAAFVNVAPWYWWVDALGTVFQVPRTGVYNVHAKLRGQNNHATLPAHMFLTVGAMTTAPAITTNIALEVAMAPGAGHFFGLYTGGLVTATAGTHSVGMAWGGDSPGTSAMYGVFIEITPIRVS